MSRAGPADFLFPQLLSEVRALVAAVHALEEKHAVLEDAVVGLGASVGQSVDGSTRALGELRDGFGRLDASLIALSEHFARQETAIGKNVNDLIGGFGRLDASLADLVGQFGRLDTSVMTLGERFAAQEALIGKNLNDLIGGFGRLDASIVTFSATAGQTANDLIGGFGRLDSAIVAFGERIDHGLAGVADRVDTSVASIGHRVDAAQANSDQRFGRLDTALSASGAADLIAGFGRLDTSIVTLAERLDVLDRSIGEGVDMTLNTVWQAKAAVSAELADVPQQLADAGIGGGFGRSEDGVPLGELLFPRVPRSDVEFLDINQEVAKLGARTAVIARDSTNKVLASLEGVDLSALGRNSPELLGIDWRPYIELSVIRVAHTVAALGRHVQAKARVLDFGAYFGNFSLALAAAGYSVEAVDAYSGPFGGAMEPFATMMRAAGVTVHDVADVGYDFAGLQPESYDAVLFMGAIEHVPHTPRVAFDAINRALKRGGVLILDTPNLGYAYNRRKFVAGKSVFPPIEHQFEAEIPFFGHHREYLPEEVRWMLERVGHEVLEDDGFNYSGYGMTEIRGEHLALWRLMQEHPHLRELIFTVSRRQ